MKDARTLALSALDLVQPEPYDTDWQSAEVEAALRRVIRALDVHVSKIVEHRKHTGWNVIEAEIHD